MADSVRDLVLPCLLDRLTDDQPKAQDESRQERGISLRQYKRAVLRDLEMLLNSRRCPSGDPVYDFALVAGSVINYGIQDLCGRYPREIDRRALEGQVRQAILDFEPRIVGKSLEVRLVAQGPSEAGRTLAYEIRGEVWAYPMPEPLFVKTEVDLENGHCTLKGEAIG